MHLSLLVPYLEEVGELEVLLDVLALDLKQDWTEAGIVLVVAGGHDLVEQVGRDGLHHLVNVHLGCLGLQIVYVVFLVSPDNVFFLSRL